MVKERILSNQILAKATYPATDTNYLKNFATSRVLQKDYKLH